MDRESFQRFYERSAPALRSYLRMSCRNTALADDLLQECFLKLLRSKLPDLEEAQLKSYLYKTAHSVMADHYRRKSREPLVPAAYEETAAPAFDLPLDLSRILGRLSERDQQLLWLAYVEGFSHREIAEQTDLAENSVRVLLARARERTAELLADSGLGPEDVKNDGT